MKIYENTLKSMKIYEILWKSRKMSDDWHNRKSVGFAHFLTYSNNSSGFPVLKLLKGFGQGGIWPASWALTSRLTNCRNTFVSMFPNHSKVWAGHHLNSFMVASLPAESRWIIRQAPEAWACENFFQSPPPIPIPSVTSVTSSNPLQSFSIQASRHQASRSRPPESEI